jgi:hypothetical protein
MSSHFLHQNVLCNWGDINIYICMMLMLGLYYTGTEKSHAQTSRVGGGRGGGQKKNLLSRNYMSELCSTDRQIGSD